MIRTVLILILWVPTVITWVLFSFLFRTLDLLNGPLGLMWHFNGVIVLGVGNEEEFEEFMNNEEKEEDNVK
ncbi:MAG: hypothetical protein RLY43_2343 [Bacteroidota bacterium]|jgi:hypothetical protein